MALAYSQFGTRDLSLYASYLLTHYVGSGGLGVASEEGVVGCSEGELAVTSQSFGRARTDAVACIARYVRESGGCVCSGQQLGDTCNVGGRVYDGERVCGDDGRSGSFCDAQGGGVGNADCGLCTQAECVGDGEYAAASSCQRGPVSGVETGTWSECGRTCSRAGAARVACDAFVVEDGASRIVGEGVKVGVSAEKGKNWSSNQRKAKKRRMARANWREGARPCSRPLVDGSGGCVSSESDCGSVATVDTRTAVEIEASQTLAARRVAENKYEIARLQAKTRSFDDKSKTEALGRLEAARMEQRINQAIARSQKAYGETDRSLKSLGSTGSAGEFALKKEVKRGEEARIERDYLKEQVGKMLRFVPASVKEEIANMKPPVFPTDEEIFGDCPDSWSDTEKMDYYDEQERHDEELAARSFDHRIIREPENVVFSSALQEDMRRLRDLTVFE